MVNFSSFMALSTLIIAPTLASELWNIETRDVAESHLFGRDMEGLFAREQDFELPDLARFRVNGAGVKTKKCEEGSLCHDDADRPGFTRQQTALHAPFHKHELYIRDFIDDLLERSYDDLDYM